MKEIRPNDAQALLEVAQTAQEYLVGAGLPDNDGGKLHRQLAHSITSAKTNAGYNGYTNYETWAVCLWLDNDQGLYEESCGIAREAYDESLGNYAEKWPKDLRAAHRKGRAAEALKGWLAEIQPDFGASLWSDLLGAAFSVVDWFAVAESRLEG